MAQNQINNEIAAFIFAGFQSICRAMSDIDAKLSCTKLNRTR